MVLKRDTLCIVYKLSSSFSIPYGSNGVEAEDFEARLLARPKFQYPLRIEWCWSLMLGKYTISPYTVSVSPTDRMVLKLYNEPEGNPAEDVFQYPLRIEWCWSEARGEAEFVRTARFSIPYGSNGVEA